MIFGCLKERGVCIDEGYTTITNDERSFVPYQGNETLNFIDDDSLILELEGIGRNITKENYKLEQGKETDYLCQSYDYDYDETKFISADASYNINIILDKYPPRVPSDEVFFKIYINNEYLFFINKLDSLCIINDKTFICYDSLMIKNKKYYDVILLFDPNNSPNQILDSIYYSTDIGIIKFNTKSGQNWYLNN